MALDKDDLLQDIQLHFERAGLDRPTAYNEALAAVEAIHGRVPELFEEPKISPQRFIQERIAVKASGVTWYEKVVQTVIKHYVDSLPARNSGAYIPNRTTDGLLETLKIIAEQWKDHPDYQRIEWP